MAKPFEDLMWERPGNPERRARFKVDMRAELRRYQLAEANAADVVEDSRAGAV